jgi:predicted nuclease of predicted toxin-antitoxin system
VRFLIDANLPRRLRTWLITRGHECEHVLDLGLGQGSDGAIWTRCGATGATIISKDEDFAHWVRGGRPGPAVVWLRTGNGTTQALIASLEPAMHAVESRLAAGDRLIEVRA